MDDEFRSGWPSTNKSDENVIRFRKLLNINHRMSIQMIVETLNIPKIIDAQHR